MRLERRSQCGDTLESLPTPSSAAVPAEVVEREKAVARQTAIDSGKKPEVVEKMMGKRIGLLVSSEETFPTVSASVGPRCGRR